MPNNCPFGCVRILANNRLVSHSDNGDLERTMLTYLLAYLLTESPGWLTYLTLQLVVIAHVGGRCPNGEVVNDHGDDGHAADDDLSASRPAEHLSLEWKLDN